MKSKLVHFIFYWLPPFIWAGIIFKLSSGSVPKASDIYWQDFAFKKSAHALFFGVLAVLIYRALIKSGLTKKKALIWSVAISTFYGLTDEYHQSFTQSRESRLRDVGFDGLGSAVAVLLTYYILPKMPPKIMKIAKWFEIV